MLKRLGFLTALIAGPAWAGLMVGSPSGGTIPDDVTLPVSTTPVGAVSANSYTGWTNPADTAANSTNWTSPSTSIRYLYPTDSKYPVATTIGQWRDVEVTTWMRRGCVLVRWAGTTAVYFIFNEETNTFSAGVRTGINPGGAQTGDCPNSSASVEIGSFTPSSIPGYSSTDTAAQTYTFGCSAWECYAKFNGSEFWRSEPDIRWPMEAGTVALSVPNTSYGFRNTSVDWLPLETIYSIPSASIYDMRDFGFYSVETTGSISASSTSLTVASSAGYAVGDQIIVECGYEAGACARATVGVGGTWPNAHYANDAAMDAAVPCTANSYAYLDDSNKVRQCASNGASWNAWAETLYYTNTKLPRALSATITNISGNTLTLDTAASATATNAKVYRDSSQFMDMFANNVGNSAFTPVGTYRFAERTVWQSTSDFYLRDNVTVEGAGLNKDDPNYTLYTPDGSIPASLAIVQADYVTVDGVYIRGTGGEKYGLYWTENGVFGFTYSKGISFSTSTGNSLIDSGAFNTLAAAADFSYCTDCTATRPYARVTYSPVIYIGSWKINFSDSSGGTVTDAEVDSDWLINGFEFFRSDGAQATGFTGRNALVSSNSSGGGWLWEDFVLDFDEDSANYALRYGALDGWVMSVNSNIQPPNPSMQEGGTIRNPMINLEYLVLSTHYLPVGIVINQDNPNITVEGTYPTCSSPKGLISTPGWFSGTNSFYGVGVRTSGDNTVVEGIRFEGDADYAGGKANIVAGEGPTNKTTTITNNVMDHAAVGTFTKIETGTITNSAYEALCP